MLKMKNEATDFVENKPDSKKARQKRTKKVVQKPCTQSVRGARLRRRASDTLRFSGLHS